MRKFLLALVVFLRLAIPAQAATAHVQTYSATPASASSYTITSVDASAGNYMTACVMLRGTENISGVTFNSSATGWSSIGDSGAQATGTREHCYGAASLSGTASVVITLSAAPAFAHAVVTVWSGVDVGGTPTGTAVENNATATSLTISAVGSNANSLVYGVLYLRANDAGVTPGGTEVYETAEGGFGSTGSAQYVTGSASTNVSWTGFGSANVGGLALSINGTGGGGASTPPPVFLSLTNVGF
jgi:hypothetical protein